jgi:dihydroorotase
LILNNCLALDLKTNTCERLNIRIQDNRIQGLSQTEFTTEGVPIFDAQDAVVLPGLLDLHVHFREPGFEAKETLATGTAAALAGGFSRVAVMPNTQPALDNLTQLAWILEKTHDYSVQILPIAAITQGRQGQVLTDIPALAENGAVAFSDDGSTVMNTQLMRRALEYAAEYHIPIIQHCEDLFLAGNGVMHEGEISRRLGWPGIPGLAEDVIVARDLLLAAETGGHLHIAHISTAKSVDLVRQAKAAGIPVTCEVTPHHFILDHTHVLSGDPNLKMNPPLRTQADVQAIHIGLADGTIDVIASDHAPHTEAEKQCGFLQAPFGILGLETMLALTLTYLVDRKILSLSEIIQKMAVNPAKILGLECPSIKTGVQANLILVQPNQVWQINKNQFYSKSRNTPFHGWQVKGLVVGGYHQQFFWRTQG